MCASQCRSQVDTHSCKGYGLVRDRVNRACQEAARDTNTQPQVDVRALEAAINQLRALSLNEGRVKDKKDRKSSKN